MSYLAAIQDYLEHYIFFPLSTEIMAYYLLGVFTTLVLVWLTIRWRIKLSEEKRQQLLLYAKKEAEYEAREIKNTAELEIERFRAQKEKEINTRQMELIQLEKELQAADNKLAHKREDYKRQVKELETERESIAERDRMLADLTRSYLRRMEQLAHMKTDQVKRALFEEIRRECEADIRRYKSELLGKGEREVETEARRVLMDSMQRLATHPAHDMSATIIPIPNEDMKGRLIGREGRNIKSFEQVTGVTLLIDETPDSVLISSFDPVRREVARIALESLMKDGRIHPATIEEAVQEAQDRVQNDVMEFGEEAIQRLGLGKVHPEILTVLGKLHYRQSLSQNALEHSIEVAFFCSLVASELGLDSDIAKRVGLLHDIGKSLDHEHEGSHAAAAAHMLARLGEDKRVVNAVAASHEEVAAESPYASLLHIADAVSAARPGARADSMAGYVERIKSLESLALDLEGIQEAYAIKAGREIRVVVEPDKIIDERAREIARELRKRIEEQVDYPSSIKITVIREQRFSETAT